jgi:RHS repeat-associated protein
VYEYDVAGRAWKVTHPDGGIVNTTYTSRGEVATTYGARSYPVEHTYDSHGRMKTLKTWQDKTAGTGVAVTTWTYDAYRGWLTAKRYEGRTTSVEYEYTPGGRLKLRRWERNASTGGRLVTTYRHGIPAESALGLPVDGGLHRIEYGATAVGTPEVRYTYDRAGRRISTRQFNGATELRRVDWQPDETGAFGTETLVESGATTFTLTRGADSVLRPGSLTLQRTATNVLAMTYGYDTASRLTSVSDGTLSATYAYQANSDLLSTITLRNGATTRLTTTRVYDRWGRLQSQWAVANAASVQPVVGSGYNYNAAGQRIRQDLGDGTYWTYAYDTLGQLTGAQRRWPDGTLVAGQQYGYLYDDIGNRKQSQEGGDANGAGLQTTTYTANLLNQYSSITTPGVASVNGLANTTNTVTVNGAATVRQGEYWWRETSVANASAPVWASLNVAASNGGTTNTTVNRYVPKASETPTYDDDGNQTGDGRWIYRWDAENRLVEMETTSTAITAGVPYAKVRWTYDPLGRRIQRESWHGASPSVVSRYVYDGWQCLAELDGSNAVTATYAWGLDLSGSRIGAGGVGGLLWVNHTQHGRHFYSYDGNGNVCGLTSAADGTRAGGYEYDPFGRVIRASEAHLVAGWNEWRFGTKRVLQTTDIVLYEYRAFGAYEGRWKSFDPAEEEGGANLLGFLGNFMLGLIDVDGRLAQTDSVSATATQSNGAGVVAREFLRETLPRTQPAPMPYPILGPVWEGVRRLCRPKVCCACVRDVRFETPTPFYNSFYGTYGHDFNVVIEIDYVKDPSRKGGDFSIEWLEKSNRPPGFYPVGPSQWINLYDVNPTSPVFKNLAPGAYLRPCPGYLSLTLSDSPSASTKLPRRSLWFDITVNSSLGCPCPISRKRIRAVQYLEFDQVRVIPRHQIFNILSN